MDSDSGYATCKYIATVRHDFTSGRDSIVILADGKKLVELSDIEAYSLGRQLQESSEYLDRIASFRMVEGDDR